MSFRLRYPCEQSIPITQYFMENPGIYSRFGLPGHDGLDFGTPPNSSIYAPADGIVRTVDFAADGYGNWIKLIHNHDDGVFETLFAHLNLVRVQVGQSVRAGDVIGFSGNTGFSFGPHLHFSLQLRGATDAGFTRYTGYGRTVTFPRNFLDPAPWLLPVPSNMPIQPVHINHPARSLKNPTRSSLENKAVTVVTQVNNLKVRQTPSTDQPEITQLPEGTELTVKAMDVTTNFITWRQINQPTEYAGKWVAYKFGSTVYLRETGEPVEVGTLEIEPDANPRVATATAPSQAGLSQSATKSSGLKMRVVNTGSQNLTVREAPTTDSLAVAELPDDTVIEVQPKVEDRGDIQWRQLIEPTEHADRWVAQRAFGTVYLEQLSGDTRSTMEMMGVSAKKTATQTTKQPIVKAPSDAVQMVVANTGAFQLKVRTEPDTSGEIVAKLVDGTAVWVTPEVRDVGNITWRQFAQPSEHAGMWAAQRFFNTQYLLPAPK